MAKLPSVPARAVISAFEKAGYVCVRTAGSHHLLEKTGSPYVLSVPVHGGKNVKPGTLRSLIRTAGMSVDDFVALLNA